MSVDFQRKEFTERESDWRRIDDVTAGRNVKQYLRTLRKTGNENVEDADRQEQYAENAIFYEIAGHTLRGLVGTAVRRDPVFEPPGRLQYVESNIDGAGNGIDQQVREALSEVIKKGRAGLWVTYPETGGEISQADQERFRATAHLIDAGQIINWRTGTDGSRVRLELVVFAADEETIAVDGFSIETQEVRRVLMLTPDESGATVYQTQKYVKVKSESGEEEWIAEERVIPTNGDGQPFTEIPFTFIGARNNDASVDDPPLLGLVNINVGHYRNSADYEDSVWYSGQSQPYMTGIDDQTLEMIKNEGIRVGSRFLMPVPAGETFGFATPDANPLVRQAMTDKVEMMIGLGARFVTDSRQSKTATEARQDDEAATSPLSTIVQNVADAYTRALRWLAAFMAEPQAPEYIMDSDFTDLGSSSEMLAKWVKSYLDGAVPQSEYIGWMQRQGYFDASKSVEQLSDELADAAVASGESSLPGAGGAET